MEAAKRKLRSHSQDLETNKIAKLAPATASCIDKLSPKLLEKILSYIPNLRDAALVSKSFYSAACELDNKRDTYKLVFDGSIDALDSDAITASIRSSKRKVTEIEIEGVYLDDYVYELFLVIFVRFRIDIKKLTINRCVLDEARLCGLLSFLRNIEEFALTRTRLNRHFIPCFNYSLKHLKKLDLSLTYCYEAKFGNKGDTFAEELMSMINRGSPVEDLRADFNFLGKFQFQKKKLKQLSMQNIKPQNMRISTVISSQYRLQSLDLMSCFIMDDILLAIKHDLPGLKTLKIALSRITCYTFLHVVPNMKNLTELHINAGTARWLTVAADEMSFPKIETLYLNVDLLLLDQSMFQGIFAKFPKVHSLHVVTNFTEIMSAIYKNLVPMPIIKCTIDISNIQRTSSRGFSPKVSQRDHLVKELKISNIDGDFAENADFFFLGRFVNVEKLIITGFILNSKLHQQALVPPHLAHLELAEFGQGSEYIIDKPAEQAISKSLKLKVMKIECEESILSPELGKQFPLIYRRGVEQVFRQR